MKRIICFLAMMLMLFANVTVSAQKKSKAERKAEIARVVKQKVEDKHFKVIVDMAYPMEGPTIPLNQLYSLEVKGDSIISYLPYYGRAYSIPYGGGKGLNFEGTIKKFRISYPKESSMRVDFEVTNDEDYYMYALDIYNNGNTSIVVIPQRRNSINFTGKIETGL
jgi:hypothetical protein